MLGGRGLLSPWPPAEFHLFKVSQSLFPVLMLVVFDPSLMGVFMEKLEKVKNDGLVDRTYLRVLSTFDYGVKGIA